MVSPRHPSNRFLPARDAGRRGFTLVELVVVMAMIALLLTLAVPRYFSSLDNGRRSVQAQNIATVRDAIDKFYGDNGRYPDALAELVTKRYLRTMPIDPVTDLSDWVTIAPSDPALGGIYDIRSAVDPAQAASRGVGTPTLPALPDPSQGTGAGPIPQADSGANRTITPVTAPTDGNIDLSGKVPMFPAGNAAGTQAGTPAGGRR
jgi:general secretion pathway protein G